MHWRANVSLPLLAFVGLAAIATATPALVGVASAAAATPAATRISGPDRYATAAAISASYFAPGVPVAYLATGTTYPDALAGGPAAAAAGGPLLLVVGNSIPGPTAAELTRLQPKEIIILGGTASVSPTVQTAAAAYTSGAVTRIAGVDRYDTAAQVAETFPAGTPVLLATGASYPDALAGAAAAVSVHAAILLTDPTQLPATTIAALAVLHPSSITIIGGTASVSATVQTAAAAFTNTAVTRVAGVDRYDTAAQVAARYFAGAMDAYVASGQGFPDALAGGVVAGLRSLPLLLSAPTCVPAATTGAMGLTMITLLGGTATLSDGVANWTTCSAPVQGSAHLYYLACPQASSSSCTGGSIQKADLDGGHPTTVSNTVPTFSGFAVSPDGTTLVESSYVGGHGVLLSLDLASGSTTQITSFAADELGNDSDPVYSPDGTKMSEFRDRFGRSYWSTGPYASFFVLNADGSGRIALPDTVNDLGWSPDGSTFAVAVSHNGLGELGTMTAPSGPITILYAPTTEAQPQPGQLAWSPDGSSIAVDVYVNGHFQLNLFSLVSKTLRTLDLATGCDLSSPVFSRDGTFVYSQQSCLSTGASLIVRTNVASGQTTTIPTPAGSNAMDPQLGP